VCAACALGGLPHTSVMVGWRRMIAGRISAE
jgi:hypothetical protein